MLDREWRATQSDVSPQSKHESSGARPWQQQERFTTSAAH
jgi:hypothetical protein